MELFRGIMPHNTNNCGSVSSSSSSSSSTVSTPTVNQAKSSPPSPSSHHNHPHNPSHHHHSSHHSHGHHSSHHYHHSNNPTNVGQATASILQPNSLTSRNNNIKQHSYFPPNEIDLDQQLLVQNSSSTTNNNSASRGLMDSINTTSTVVVRKQSRTKTDRLLYEMVNASASVSNVTTNDDLGNESFKSDTSFPAGFPAPPGLPNGGGGLPQQATAPSAGSNSQATNNNRTIEMSSRYFLETECCNGPNRDNLHLNGSGEVGKGSSSLLNETDEHSFPNQINAYNSGHETDEELEKCRDISEYTE